MVVPMAPKPQASGAWTAKPNGCGNPRRWAVIGAAPCADSVVMATGCDAPVSIGCAYPTPTPASPMASSPLTPTLLAAKQRLGLSFAELGARLGRDEVWVAALVYGQATATSEQALTLLQTLELDPALATGLTTYPVKGALDPVIPTDPLLYRFYEILQVYGLPLKDVIQEKFGDGIMSAIDFTLHVDKVDDPKGDRVKVTMNGKFLPYKAW